MFRFTIRDVLWLTVLVAVLTAWWLSHRQQAADAVTRMASLTAKYNQLKANHHALTMAAKSKGDRHRREIGRPSDDYHNGAIAITSPS